MPLKRHDHQTKVRGAGGEAQDISWVGVELRNGLAGECAVTLRATIHRIVCANGMICPVADTKQRIRHVGDSNALHAKVVDQLCDATSKVSRTVEWLNTLGNKVFSAADLAADRDSMRLVRRMLDNLDRGSRWSSRLGKSHKEDRRELISKMVCEIADVRAGAVWHSTYRDNATWWDFLNVFTQAAQEGGSLEKQLRVEEQAGRWQTDGAVDSVDVSPYCPD